jgi:hypothetical protein
MAGNKLQHWGLCEAVASGVAETLTIEQIMVSMRITNYSGGVLYVLFDWVATDTEVSATNFNIALANGESFELNRGNMKKVPRIGNLRVISTGSGSVAVWGW